MWECLEFDTIKSLSINEQLLERCEVAHRDLILEQLERFLVIANSGIQNYVGRVLAKDGLVRIRTRGRWHKDLRLLDLTASCIGASGRLCCRLCIKLFVQASKTVVILAPFSLFDVDFLLFGLRLRLICAFSS